MDGAVVSYPGANGGEVGGSLRRERYTVPGTAPWRKRNVVSHHFTELVLKIAEMEVFPDCISIMKIGPCHFENS